MVIIKALAWVLSLAADRYCCLKGMKRNDM